MLGSQHEGLVTNNVPIRQLKLYYTSFTPLLLHCSESKNTHIHPPLHHSFLLHPSSLHSLLVGSATRVLRLHHIREFWGAGEGLNVQLFEHLICKKSRKKTLATEDQSCDWLYKAPSILSGFKSRYLGQCPLVRCVNHLNPDADNKFY